MLYAVQGPAPERDSSLILSMQLMELCKASGCRGSGDGCYGLQDYFPVAPWRSSATKTSQEKLSRLQLNKVGGMQVHTNTRGESTTDLVR
jgi:hypothetical protein